MRAVKRALVEFLALPGAIVAGFILLAVVAYAIEQLDITWLAPARTMLARHGFGNATATSTLLGGIAAGLITVTSITFSLLLIAVQQSAAALTSQVFDQFLRRRLNQVFFGFFVGLSLYALLLLATVRPDFNPVLGATVALVLTAVALCCLIVLIYVTIDQARPAVVVKAIHDHTLAARRNQQALLRETRLLPTLDGRPSMPVRARADGYVTAIQVGAIHTAIGQDQQTEVVLRVATGSYVAFDDPIATVVSSDERATAIAGAVRRAVVLDRVRDFDHDPAYGIQQLAHIAWRSVSTSQQNPSPGLLVVDALRDVLARWSAEPDLAEIERSSTSPVVYADDVVAEIMDAFESIAVVASESMQHQTFAAVTAAVATMLSRLPVEYRSRAEDLVLRLLPALGDFVLTAPLDDALSTLAAAFAALDLDETATAVRAAHAGLARSVGTLNSRATRVPTDA